MKFEVHKYYLTVETEIHTGYFFDTELPGRTICPDTKINCVVWQYDYKSEHIANVLTLVRNLNAI